MQTHTETLREPLSPKSVGLVDQCCNILPQLRVLLKVEEWPFHWTREMFENTFQAMKNARNWMLFDGSSKEPVMIEASLVDWIWPLDTKLKRDSTRQIYM